MYLTKKHVTPSHRPSRHGRDRRAAVPGSDGAGAHDAGEDRRRGQDPARLHRDGARRRGQHRRSAWPRTSGRRPPSGRNFDLSPSSMSPLEPFRDYLTIISNTDCKGAEAVETKEIGGDHFRSSAVFLTQMHPKQTEGSDINVGVSLDQMYAQRFGQDTPIPSMQLCIENVDQAGGCAYGYACVYTDTISWATPTEPLPMIRDPRVAFDQLFGVGATPSERAANRRTDRSILDWVTGEVARIASALGPDDRRRLDRVPRPTSARSSAASSASSRTTPAASRAICRARRWACPTRSSEHVKLMFDLQALAFAADITRVFSFKLGRDGSARVYPESGVGAAVPPRVAPRRERGARPAVRADQQVPRRPGAVLPGQAEEHPGRGRATCSTRRWSSTDRRWATRTCTTTSAARCSSPATPTACSRATCTSRPPTARRWPTRC